MNFYEKETIEIVKNESILGDENKFSGSKFMHI